MRAGDATYFDLFVSHSGAARAEIKENSTSIYRIIRYYYLILPLMFILRFISHFLTPTAAIAYGRDFGGLFSPLNSDIYMHIETGFLIPRLFAERTDTWPVAEVVGGSGMGVSTMHLLQSINHFGSTCLAHTLTQRMYI
jgi:hypothetical protein